MTDEVTKCLGLVNQFNPLSIAAGALALAENCVNLRENVLEDRRGYKHEHNFPSSIKTVFPYSSKIVVHHGDALSIGPSFINYTGSFLEPDGGKIRADEANSNLYLTTSKGISVLSGTSGDARPAGVPRSLDPSYALNAAGVGFLQNTYQCAYRAVITRQDSNNNLIVGYPSQRMWAANSSGTSRNLDITLPIPAECKAGDIVAFYRTAQIATVATDIAGDEMALVYQYSLTSSDISSGSITFIDSITDELRGATLYTSPSQQGISQANERPPLCKDIAFFKSAYMFYANTKTKHRLFLTLVGTALLSGKSVKIAGVDYKFGASEIISGAGAPQAKVSTTGVLAVDIDQTARSLIRVINRYALNTSVYAFYLTGPDDLPGQILIEERIVGGAAFTAQSQDSSVAQMFFPAPPIAPATDLKSTSTNQSQPNAIFFSKYQEVEHVPVLNYVLAGPSNKAILRIVALRESLIIVKEEGVYRLSGETPQSFSVTPLDLTVFCKSAESVAVVANQVYMLSNQGIVAISETGVQVVSREIEPTIKKIILKNDLSNLAFAIGYESDRHYILSTITDRSDTQVNQTLVYNVFTRTWVKWTYAFTAGTVEPITDKMYFSKSGRDLFAERKDSSNTDYADPEHSIEIISVDAVKKLITFTLIGAVPDIGWVIEQNGTQISLLEIKTLAGRYEAKLSSEPPTSWVAGPAVIYPSVAMNIEWAPWTGQKPSMMKQVRCAKILTDSTIGANSSSLLEATFKSNFDEETESVSLAQESAGWGGPWGNMLWGGGSDSYGYPTWVPLNKQYCTRLSVGVRHKNALEKASICGFAVDFEYISDRIGS